MKEGSAEPRKVSGEAVALRRPLPFRSWPIDTAPSFPPCTCPAPRFRFRAWRHRLWVLKYPGVKGCCVWSVLGDCSSVMVHRLWQRREKQRPSSLFSSWITGKVQSHHPPAPTFPSDQRRHPRCIVAGGDAREDSAWAWVRQETALASHGCWSERRVSPRSTCLTSPDLS